jgi:hypothetical protein
MADRPVSREGEPAWDIALLYPNQGHWSEAEYLALNTNRMVELSDGCLEVLPMPTLLHQFIVEFFFTVLKAHVTVHVPGGRVVFPPVPVRLNSPSPCW